MQILTNMRPLLFLKKFSRIRKLYIFAVLLSILLFVVLVLLQQYFSIAQIIVNNTEYIESYGSGTHSLNGLSNLKDENILFLNTEALEKTVYHNNPAIRKITVTKKYPHTLYVDVKWNEPFVQLRVNEGYFILSDDGRIVSKTREKDNALAEITYYQQLNFNSFQSGDQIYYKDIVSSLHFLKLALDLGFKINMIDINGFNMIGLLAKDKEFVFTTEKDTAIQDYQFTRLIKQFKIEGTDFKVLDLRFDKPVIQIKK